MIQAEELRIGNWITTIINDNWIKVDKISKQSVKDGFFYLINEFIQDHVHPIPLTPEILEGCGFKPEGLQCDFSNNEIDLDKTDNGFKVSFNGSMEGVELKYLHQLQNLYFALTGKELEIKLPVLTDSYNAEYKK